MAFEIELGTHTTYWDSTFNPRKRVPPDYVYATLTSMVRAAGAIGHTLGRLVLLSPRSFGRAL